MAVLHETHARLGFRRNEDELNLRGMALLAPAGCRPHQVLWPYESAMVVKLLRKDSLMISALASHVIKAIYTKRLGFLSDAPLRTLHCRVFTCKNH